MSAPRWRWSLTSIWLAFACTAFLAIGSTAPASRLLLLTLCVIPPMMVLWRWKEDRRMLLATLRPRTRL